MAIAARRKAIAVTSSRRRQCAVCESDSWWREAVKPKAQGHLLRARLLDLHLPLQPLLDRQHERQSLHGANKRTSFAPAHKLPNVPRRKAARMFTCTCSTSTCGLLPIWTSPTVTLCRIDSRSASAPVQSVPASHRCHVCAGTGLAPTTSAPELGTPRPHLRQDWAHPFHICAGTGLTEVSCGASVSLLPNCPTVSGGWHSLARRCRTAGCRRIQWRRIKGNERLRDGRQCLLLLAQYSPPNKGTNNPRKATDSPTR